MNINSLKAYFKDANPLFISYPSISLKVSMGLQRHFHDGKEINVISNENQSYGSTSNRSSDVNRWDQVCISLGPLPASSFLFLNFDKLG